MTAAGLLLANESERNVLREVTELHVANACIRLLTFEQVLRTGQSTMFLSAN